MSKNITKAELIEQLRAAEKRISELELALKQPSPSTNTGQEKEKLARLLEVLPVGVSILDADRKVVYENPALQRILDLSAEDLRTGAYKNRRYLSADGSPMPSDGFASIQAQKSGRPAYNVETGIVKDDGETIWTNVSAVPVDFPDWKTVIVTADITARKKAEDTIHSQQRNLDALIENTDGSIWSVDGQYRLIVGNTLYHHNTSAVLGRRLLEGESVLLPNFPKEALDEWRGYYVRALMGERFSVEVQTRFATPAHYMEYRFNPITTSEGVITGVTIYGRDITARKQAEEQLRESEARFHGTLDAMQEGVILIGMDWRYLYINKSAEIQGRRPAEELLGKTVMECWPGIETTDFFHLEQKVMQDRLSAQIEDAFAFPNGETRWFYWNIQPATDGLLIVTQDITERKQAEIKRDQFAERLDLATQSAGMGIWDWNIQKNDIVWDNQMYALYGVKPGEFNSAHEIWQNRVHSDDRATRNEAIAAAMRGEQNYDIEFRILWSDDSVHWLKANGLVFRDESGTPLRMVGINYDITERKLLETNLSDSEQRYTLLFNKSTIPVALLKLPEVVIADVNEAAEKLTGFTREEMLGKTAAELGLISHKKRVEEIQQFEKERTLAENERRITTKSGEERIVLSNTNPLEIGGKPYAITSLQDITARKQAEDALEHMRIILAEAQRIAHLGSFEYIAATQMTIWSEEEYRIYGLDPAGPSPAYEVMLQKCIHPDDAALLHETFTKAMQSLSIYELEHRIVRPDGSVRWVYDSAHPYLNEQGELVRYIGATLDITERKQVEQKLRESERRLSSLVTASSEVLYQMSADWKVMLQLSSEGFLADTPKPDPNWIDKYIHPDDQPQVKAAIQEAIRTRSVFEMEHRVLSADGKLSWTSSRAIPIMDEHGEIVEWFGAAGDITARKQAEEKLRESEWRLREAQHIARIGSWEWNPQTRESHWSLENYALYGLDPDAPPPTPEALVKFVHPDDLQTVTEVISKATSEGASGDFEYRIILPDGAIRTIHAMGVATEFNADGNPTLMVGTNQDITERKQAEAQKEAVLEKLRESEEFLRLAYEATDLGIWKNDLQTGSVEFDERARIHYGFDTLHTTLAEVTSRVHPEDVARLGSEIAAATAPTGSGKFSTEYRVIHPDGSAHWLAIGVQVTFEGEGEQRHAVMGYGTTLDITARKQAEMELRVALTKYKTLFDTFPLGITISDSSGSILETNSIAEKLLGLSKEEQEKRQIDGGEWRIIRTDGTPMPVEEYPSVRAHKEGQKVENVEMGVFKPDGNPTWINVTAAPMPLEGYGVIVTYNDITERKRMDDELRRSNAELEQFAYVASHDLQEPLRAVAGMVQLLQKRYQGQLDARADEYIGHAVEASARMQSLIQDLLEYSRVDRRGHPIEMVDAETCLKAALKNLETTIQESHAEVVSDSLPIVHADSTQLTQLFQNLVGNSIKFRRGEDPRVSISATRVNNAWRFSIRDNGIGIEPQYYERIFLVFQRLHTRREYQGTGIGLALCKKIVERHGGSIRIEFVKMISAFSPKICARNAKKFPKLQWNQAVICLLLIRQIRIYHIKGKTANILLDIAFWFLF